MPQNYVNEEEDPDCEAGELMLPKFTEPTSHSQLIRNNARITKSKTKYSTSKCDLVIRLARKCILLTATKYLLIITLLSSILLLFLIRSLLEIDKNRRFPHLFPILKFDALRIHSTDDCAQDDSIQYPGILANSTQAFMPKLWISTKTKPIKEKMNSENEKNSKDSEFCPKPQLYEIKTELNIPDMFRPRLISISIRIDKPVTLNPTNSTGINLVTYTAPKLTEENKLKVFVVLHSHNDPGWLKTFQQYYVSETKSILDNLLKYLTLDPELKFIWSEISFFDLWWRDLPTEKRKQVKVLVENGQLEFVGGGWVMHDEATPHYSSMITQLMEGHQWLQQHLNYTPRNGWAIDPFGQSSTSNYLLQRSGFKNTVFSRINYRLREMLKAQEQVEFYWRQPWDSARNTDIFCYQMPYGTYDLGSTCGPDYASNFGVCRSYIFYSGPNVEENEREIQRRAHDLLRQYQRKSELFRTKNLFQPLGKDFAWQTDSEWTRDLQNLKAIIKYINSNEALHTHIKFATLNEYFEAVHADERKTKIGFATFSGDFFPYTQSAEDSFWSGYYTSRVFHKASERQLMTLVRSAQLIYTLMAAETVKEFGNYRFEFISSLLTKIVESRRTLSLFQHHDGIAGTSTDHVVKDYSEKLFSGMKDCQFVIQQCLFALQNLQGEKERNPVDTHAVNFEQNLKNITATDIFYDPSIHKSGPNMTWQNKLFKIDATNPVQIIVAFNSLAKKRKQVVGVDVTSYNLKVMEGNGKELASEIFPVFKYYDKYNTKNESLLEAHDYYQLFFVAEFRPLEVKNFKIVYSDSIAAVSGSRARVKVFNTKTNFPPKFTEIFTKVEASKNSGSDNSHTDGPASSKDKTIQISNHYLKINVYQNGPTKSVELNGVVYPLEITFRYYKTTRSGAYMFTPNDVSKPVQPKNVEPVIIVVEGKIRSYVEVWYPTVRHRITLLNHDGLEGYGMDVENIIDIRSQYNYELIMKIRTGIESTHTLFTDSNGFQMMRRKYRSNETIQGNYYPLATSAYIEDPGLRMTLLAAQPGGCSSLASGQLEVMLDRIVHQDDGHGLGQGASDNSVTVSKFKIMLEKPSVACHQNRNRNSADNAGDTKKLDLLRPPLPLLSLEANLQQLTLLHPLQIYAKIPGTTNVLAKGDHDLAFAYGYDLKVEPSALSRDIHLLGAVPLPKLEDSDKPDDMATFISPSSQSALLFHRMGVDHRFVAKSVTSRDPRNCLTKSLGHVNIKDVFGELFQAKMQRSSISLSHRDKNDIIDVSNTLTLDLMEIYAFIADYNR